MKKLICLVTFSYIFVSLSYAQPGSPTKAEKQLEANLASIDELNKMLAEKYTQKTTALEAVNGASFTFNGCKVLGSFADEGVQKQLKAMEQEFGDHFNKSAWVFDRYNPNGQSNVQVTTAAGKTESSPYTGFPGSATIRIPLLVEGLTIEAYFYQKKDNAKSFIMLFVVGNGIACAVEMFKR
ncbi:MAG: hypothetical protein JNM68_05890 [Dinghuibacter sp.]|nr:hypothetical protein [Dinghuibacter sp.]